MFDFAKTSAPASRSLRTWNASLAGIEPFNDSDPAVVGMSAVLKLSLTIRGTQCRGKTRACEFGVEASAADKALANTINETTRGDPDDLAARIVAALTEAGSRIVSADGRGSMR